MNFKLGSALINVIISMGVGAAPNLTVNELSNSNAQSMTDGILSVYRGNFETAITQLEKAVSLDPSNQMALAYLSYCHNREGARLDSDPVPAMREFCAALFMDGNNYKAIANSKHMIRLLGFNPDSAADRLELARQALTARDYMSAVVEYEASIALRDDVAIKIEPAQTNGYMNRGRANLRLQQYDSALQDLTKAISMQENFLNGKAFYYRSKVYEKLSKPDLAEADRKRAQVLGTEIAKAEE